jgi:DNA polymerase III subunit epsilon
MLPNRLTFVDVETTGASYRRDRIIEIGIIQTENGEVVSEYSSLINPGQHVPPSITEMTGISEADLENAPTFRDVYHEVAQLLEDSIFVAHNAAFDYGFIKNEFRLLEHNYSARCLCTVKLSRALFPRFKSHNLDSLINRFGFSCENRHRALDDARVMVNFINLVKDQLPLSKVEDAVDRILKRPSVPLGVDEKMLDSLPEKSGVYIFYGDSGIPLYIGKSVNIRNRVKSHFSAVSLSSIELKIAAQVKDIQTVVTGGELGALLLESELIKKHQPLYNRKLRNASKQLFLGCETDKDGFKRTTVSNYAPNQILGVFKSQKQVRDALESLADEHKLCKKLLGIEKTTRSCFGYHLGKCKGACVGEENPVMYNLRFDMAFIKTKVKSWPFNGPVVLKEGRSRYLIDNWRYKLLDSARDLGFDGNGMFDMDSYRILSSFILSDRKKLNLEVIKDL